MCRRPGWLTGRRSSANALIVDSSGHPSARGSGSLPEIVLDEIHVVASACRLAEIWRSLRSVSFRCFRHDRSQPFFHSLDGFRCGIVLDSESGRHIFRASDVLKKQRQNLPVPFAQFCPQLLKQNSPLQTRLPITIDTNPLLQLRRDPDGDFSTRMSPEPFQNLSMQSCERVPARHFNRSGPRCHRRLPPPRPIQPPKPHPHRGSPELPSDKRLLPRLASKPRDPARSGQQGASAPGP